MLPCHPEAKPKDLLFLSRWNFEMLRGVCPESNRRTQHDIQMISIKIRFRKARTLTLETDAVGACGQEMKNCIWQEVKNLTYCIDDILIWIRFTSQINFLQYHAFTGISFSEYFMTDDAIFLWSRWSKIQGKAYCIDKRRYPNSF